MLKKIQLTATKAWKIYPTCKESTIMIAVGKLTLNCDKNASENFVRYCHLLQIKYSIEAKVYTVCQSGF